MKLELKLFVVEKHKCLSCGNVVVVELSSWGAQLLRSKVLLGRLRSGEQFSGCRKGSIITILFSIEVETPGECYNFCENIVRKLIESHLKCASLMLD